MVLSTADWLGTRGFTSRIETSSDFLRSLGAPAAKGFGVPGSGHLSVGQC